MDKLYQISVSKELSSSMGKPKKQTSPRKTGLRRSHLTLKLARVVNGKSPVKVTTTKRETGKKA